MDITSTVGAISTQVFRWNSTWDPDFTGTGHQPLYRDTYAGIYDQYVVVSARAHIRVINNSATSGFIVYVNTDDDSTFSTSKTVLAEQSHGYTTILTQLAGSRSHVDFTVEFDAATFFNIDPYSSQSYQTAVGTNPTEEAYLGVSVSTIGGATASCNMQIVLEQTVLWTELQTPSSS